MVKNTKGGNKSKGMARKHAGGGGERNLRLSTCNLEVYGVVLRVLGHGMFYVGTEEHPQLLGHIRNKFRGRSKRDNNITVGCVVLAGLREWEHPNYKECDLLEVYDANEVRQLMKNPSIDFGELQKFIDALGISAASSDGAAAASSGADIEFSSETDYTEGLIPEGAEEAGGGAGEFYDESDLVDANDL